MFTSRTREERYLVVFDTGYTHWCKTLRQAEIFARDAPDVYGYATEVWRYVKTTTVEKNEVVIEGVGE